MRHVSLSPLALVKATLLAAALLTACEDDVVYQDRPPVQSAARWRGKLPWLLRRADPADDVR